MKFWFLLHRGRFLRLALLITLHEIVLWSLTGHDVTGVFLAPHANTPIHWAILAALLILLRLVLILIYPGWLIWKLTSTPRRPSLGSLSFRQAPLK